MCPVFKKYVPYIPIMCPIVIFWFGFRAHVPYFPNYVPYFQICALFANLELGLNAPYFPIGALNTNFISEGLFRLPSTFFRKYGSSVSEAGSCVRCWDCFCWGILGIHFLLLNEHLLLCFICYTCLS